MDRTDRYRCAVYLHDITLPTITICSFCALLPLSDTPGITQRPGVHATSPPLLPTIRCLLDFLAARAGVCCGKEVRTPFSICTYASLDDALVCVCVRYYVLINPTASPLQSSAVAREG